MKRLVFVFCLSVSWAAFAMLSDAESDRAAREALAKLSLQEKTQLLAGSGTMTLAALPTLGITNEWLMSDNSSTVRPKMERFSWIQILPKDQNTKLPSMEALAQTWDVAWAKRHGEVLGSECRARGVDQILGPGVNIMRQPLCGRNWEYMGEDPLLAGRIAAAMIKGVQSYDVAATVKHFALNDQELGRFNLNVHVDERALNEIYLPAFKSAVEEGGVLAVMDSYSMIDGVFASENKYLLNGILRERWGYRGLLVSDWGGHHSCDFAISNGSGIEMARGAAIRHFCQPISNRFPLAEAVLSGRVSGSVVDTAAYHVLYTMAKVGYLTGALRRPGATNTREHQLVARQEGADSIVLLKNEKNLLPLDRHGYAKVLVVGKNAVVTQCEKGGSGLGNVPYEVTFYEAMKARFDTAEVSYLPFCAAVELKGGEEDGARRAGALVRAAVDTNSCTVAELKAAAAASDLVIVCVGTELGLFENMESEGRDRVSMDLPPEIEAAMHTILDWKLPNVVVVSRSGSPVGYTWTDKAPTLLQTGYLGMEEGNAVVDVLTGEVNPSGRLVQTWPKRYADLVFGDSSAYNATNVVYAEGIYVGYRWFDRKGIAPLFAFGDGLSYTTFDYGKLDVKTTDLGWEVRVPVTNSGQRDGKEVVQLYVSYPQSRVERCARELKGFAKLALKPGETKVAEILVNKSDLAYWDVFAHRFETEETPYEFSVGSTGSDIRGRVLVR